MKLIPSYLVGCPLPVSDTTLPKEKKTYEFKRDPELDAILRRKNKIATVRI